MKTRNVGIMGLTFALEIRHDRERGGHIEEPEPLLPVGRRVVGAAGAVVGVRVSGPTVAAEVQEDVGLLGRNGLDVVDPGGLEHLRQPLGHGAEGPRHVVAMEV